MRKWFAAAALVAMVYTGTTRGFAQRWSFGGNLGVSSIGGSPGFHLTPAGEFLFNRNIGVGTEFSVNTQYTSPILWYPYLKYYVTIRGSEWRPYATAGPVLAMNVPNGPCFGALFGAGVNIPVGPGLYVGPSMLIGPVFGYGGGGYPMLLHAYYWGIPTYGLLVPSTAGETILVFSLRAAIRYEL